PDCPHVPRRPRPADLRWHQRDHEIADRPHALSVVAGKPRERLMADAFVYDAVRTPRGRGKKDGALHEVPAVRLAAKTLEAIRDRNGLDTSTVDDIIFGWVDPVGEAGSVIPRSAAFEAGYDNKAPGMQISRFCASGLDAINLGAAKIAGGLDEIVIAGGVESMSRVGMGMSGGAWFMDPSVGLPGYFVPQ